LIYSAIDSALFWLNASANPFSAEVVFDLPFVFIADKLSLSYSAVAFIQILFITLPLLVPCFLFALKTALNGRKQPDEFRKKRASVIFFIILNLLVLAIGIASMIPLDEPFRVEFDTVSAVIIAAIILPLPFFIADLAKNKKDLIEKTAK
jgi:hypothetical protein